MPKLYYKDPVTGEFKEYKPVASIPQEIRDGAALGATSLQGSIDPTQGEEIPRGNGLDVRINGESIVEGGVANFPYAGIGKEGIVRGAAWETGIRYDNGAPYVYGADKTFIDLKSNQYRPLNPKYLDYALRAGLISNSEITDADKPLICETLGAERSDYVVIVDEILAENAMIQFEFDGKYDEIDVFLEIPKTLQWGGADTAAWGYLADGTIRQDAGYGWLNANSDTNGSGFCRFYQRIWEHHGVWRSEYVSSNAPTGLAGVNGTAMNFSSNTCGRLRREDEYLGGWRQNKVLPKDTKIRITGVAHKA